jgi:hypothetical protein
MATTEVKNLNRVRYAGLDFDTHFDDLRARAQVEFAKDFNDFALSSLGIMLLDLVAYGLDSLSFYLDRRASDSYLVTARTRKGVTRLADQLGYKIGAAVASSVDLRVALETAVAFGVPLPKGFQFRGPNDLVFETAEEVVFPAGSGPTDFKTVPCYQGVTVTENFVSDGSPNQVFALRRVPDQSFVVQGTVGVLVNAAVWSESDFLTFDKTDQFSVSYGDDPPSLQFGDGEAGNIPEYGAAITVTYVASRGVAGQVAEGTITEEVSSLVVNFTDIPLIVTSPEASVGGDDSEALSKVKRLAGKVFKSRKVAVTAEDYRALAGAFADPLYGRVAAAQAISSRSAQDDLYLQNALNIIRGLIDPVKNSVNALTVAERADYDTLAGHNADIVTATGNIVTNNQTINTSLNDILTKARDSKNTAVETYNDAGDIVAEASLGSSELTAMSVATANLAIGIGAARVLYVAKVPGAVGESVRVAHVGGGGALSVAVVNKDITVTLRAVPASTASEVAAAIAASGAASALVDAYAQSGGTSSAATQPSLTNLGYTAPNSIAVSGLKDTAQALLQQRFDRCRTEASNIQSGATTLQSNLDGSPSAIVPKALVAQAAVVDSGLTILTVDTEVYAQTQATTAITALLGTNLVPPAVSTGLYGTSRQIDSAVETLDTTGTVTVSVGTELDNIFNHVDALLSADCSANLVSVPILTKNAAGFYAAPTLGLQQALQAYLDARKEVTQSVKVTSGEDKLRRPVITLRVGVALGYSESVVSAGVQTVVDGLLRDRLFGESLYVSDLDGEVRDNVAGVAFVNPVIVGWNDADGVLQTEGLDGDGNLIIQASEVITKEVRTGLPSVTVTTEIVTPT